MTDDEKQKYPLEWPLRADIQRGRDIIKSWFEGIQSEWTLDKSDHEDLAHLEALLDHLDPRDPRD